MKKANSFLEEGFWRESGFVGNGLWEVSDTYNCLLWAAMSRRHLCKMHNEIFYPHWRLLKRDLTCLVDFWGKNYSNGERNFQDSKKAVEFLTYILRLRNEACPSGLSPYYKKFLDEGRKVYANFQSETSARMLAPTINQIKIGTPDGMGKKSLFIDLFNTSFLMDILYSPSKKSLHIRVSLWQHDLTEPLTFKLSSLPPSTIGYRMNGYRGSEVDFCWVLENAGWTDKFLGSSDLLDDVQRPYNVFISGDQGQLERFCAQLKNELERINFPAISAIRLRNVPQ